MKLIFYQHFDLQQEFHTSLISFLNFELRIFQKKNNKSKTFRIHFKIDLCKKGLIIDFWEKEFRARVRTI